MAGVTATWTSAVRPSFFALSPCRSRRRRCTCAVSPPLLSRSLALFFPSPFFHPLRGPRTHSLPPVHPSAPCITATTRCVVVARRAFQKCALPLFRFSLGAGRAGYACELPPSLRSRPITRSSSTLSPSLPPFFHAGSSASSPPLPAAMCHQVFLTATLSSSVGRAYSTCGFSSPHPFDSAPHRAGLQWRAPVLERRCARAFFVLSPFLWPAFSSMVYSPPSLPTPAPPPPIHPIGSAPPQHVYVHKRPVFLQSCVLPTLRLLLSSTAFPLVVYLCGGAAALWGGSLALPPAMPLPPSLFTSSVDHPSGGCSGSASARVCACLRVCVRACMSVRVSLFKALCCSRPSPSLRWPPRSPRSPATSQSPLFKFRLVTAPSCACMLNRRVPLRLFNVFPLRLRRGVPLAIGARKHGMSAMYARAPTTHTHTHNCTHLATQAERRGVLSMFVLPSSRSCASNSLPAWATLFSSVRVRGLLARFLHHLCF